MKETKNKFQIKTEAIQESIQQELLEKLILAIDLRMVPKCIKEFEFSVEGKQAYSIVYWPCNKREPSESITVRIPTEYQSDFTFPLAAKLHLLNCAGAGGSA